MRCLLCDKETGNLGLICTSCSIIHRPDGKSVGNIDMCGKRLVFSTRRTKEHIFHKYGIEGGFGLSVTTPMRQLFGIMSRINKKMTRINPNVSPIKDVYILIMFGEYPNGPNDYFKVLKTYRTTLMTFRNQGIQPNLLDTHGDQQYVLPIEMMMEEDEFPRKTIQKTLP